MVHVEQAYSSEFQSSCALWSPTCGRSRAVVPLSARVWCKEHSSRLIMQRVLTCVVSRSMCVWTLWHRDGEASMGPYRLHVTDLTVAGRCASPSDGNAAFHWSLHGKIASCLCADDFTAGLRGLVWGLGGAEVPFRNCRHYGRSQSQLFESPSHPQKTIGGTLKPHSIMVSLQAFCKLEYLSVVLWQALAKIKSWIL